MGAFDDYVEQPGSTDDQIAAELASSPTAQGAGPTPQGAAPQSSDVPMKVSGSVDYKGSTEHGKKYASGLYGQADRAIDQFAVEDQARAGQDAAQVQQDYAGAKNATQGEIDAQKQYQATDADLQKRLFDFNMHAAATEERMNGEAIAERQKYLANYEEQLAGVRALAAQSGNPLAGMSKPEEMGLIGAQFAQGFLKARYGIDIDVAGQVDRWINRSIQEHQMQVQNARESANDQLHLYEIARQNSRDDWEARQRYRGFVIQGLQTQIQANANRFNSQIAIARANEANAKLQIEADATKRQIGDAHFSRIHQFMTTEYQKAYQQGMLGIEQIKAAAELARAKAAAKAQPVVSNMNISDPEYLRGQDGKDYTDKNGNKVLVNRWRIDPNLPKEIQTKVYEKADTARTQYANYLDATNAMMQSYQAAKQIRDKSSFKDAGWDAVARADKTGTVAKFLQDREQWVLAKVYNDSGKQVNENEFKKHEELAALDKIFARNGDKTEQLQANLREAGRHKFERNMESTGVKKIDEKDPEFFSESVQPSPRAQAEDQVIGSTDGPDKRQKMAEVAVSAAGAESGNKPAAQPSKLWKSLGGEGQQSEKDHSVDLLARVLVNPQHARAAFGNQPNMIIPDNDDLLKQEALEGLQRLAVDKDSEVSGYAEMVLQKYKDDPKDLAKQFEPDPVVGKYTPTRLKR